MYTVRIPKVGTVSADTLATLGSVAWDAVHTANGGFGYGVSEVGSGWPVKHDGVLIRRRGGAHGRRGGGVVSILRLQPLTRAEMAARSDALRSADGRSVSLADGSRWIYDDRFSHWACVMAPSLQEINDLRAAESECDAIGRAVEAADALGAAR